MYLTLFTGNLKDYKVGEVLMIGEVHNDIDVESSTNMVTLHLTEYQTSR